MKLLKTKTHPDNLNELRRRKAELKIRLDAEQAELRADWQEVRSDLRPSHIVANIIRSMFGWSGSSAKTEPSEITSNLQAPLRLATDLLVGSGRTRTLINILMPLVLPYLPRLAQKAKGISLNKSKAKVYGTLRKSIAGVRSRLKRKKVDALQEPDAVDVIQPS